MVEVPEQIELNVIRLHVFGLLCEPVVEHELIIELHLRILNRHSYDLILGEKRYNCWHCKVEHGLPELGDDQLG